MTELRVPAAFRADPEKISRCVFCEEPLDPNSRRVYRGVRGFELPRAAGGTNAVFLRRPLDEYACWSCVDKRRHGLSTEQASLL